MHECIFCGDDCTCRGDIDDVHTMKNNHCKGCGCEIDQEQEYGDPDDQYDDEDDETPTPIVYSYECLGCGNIQDHEGECEACTGYTMSPITD